MSGTPANKKKIEPAKKRKMEFQNSAKLRKSIAQKFELRPVGSTTPVGTSRGFDLWWLVFV
jgi:hypothetical protein